MSIEINDDNYFDVAECIHSILTVWHDGGHGYELLCRSQFNPGIGYRESDCQDYEVYHDILALIEDKDGKFLGYDEIEKLIDQLDEFLESKDEN